MKTSLITGASSGIGESFARKLAARGDNLLLVARSEDKLAALCSELGREHGINAQCVSLDLTKSDAPLRLFDEAARRGLAIELLVNNAGFGVVGDFASSDLQRQLDMLDLNIRALLELTHRFLGPMRERRSGAIINVASTAGFQAVPYMAAYAASKAFVLSLTEALWEENREYGIRVLALCPGVTDTNFFAAAGASRPGLRVMQTAEEVVDTGLKALDGGRSHIVSGWANYLLMQSERLVPRSLVTRVTGKALRAQLRG
jgi:short-subunit dehydrogenase